VAPVIKADHLMLNMEIIAGCFEKHPNRRNQFSFIRLGERRFDPRTFLVVCVWWAKCHWHGSFSELWFSPVSIIPPFAQTNSGIAEGMNSVISSIFIYSNTFIMYVKQAAKLTVLTVKLRGLCINW
jgi:hypothetical protein